MVWGKWRVNKQQLLIILCVGILLVLIAIPTNNSSQVIRSGNDLESRLEEILSQIEGIGEVHVMIAIDEKESVQGIAISAQGGDHSMIVKEIVEVVQALFDIETHKIKVIKGGS